MKNLLLVLGLGLALTSCKKDNQSEDCNCGTIANDDINSSGYLLEVRNDCTGNKKWFYVDGDTWLDGYVGSSQCFNNQSNW